MTSSEIQQYVYDFFTDKGLPHKTICAIMGNITGESSWNPDSIEQGNNIGFGLCQWSFGRRDQLEAYGTDLQHQCEFLWSELTGENLSVTGADFQWIAHPADSVTGGYTFSCSIDDFINGNGDIDFLTKAFCYCWERPAYATNHLDKRQESAKNFNNTMSYSGSGSNPNNDIIEKAIEWAVKIAEDNTHGYDQTDRWSPDYDCSSFLISAYRQAGMTINASYTGDMENGFVKAGFESLPFNENDLQRGDVILKDGHVVMFIGNGEIVHASINENGEITGGQTGDQTGKEICVRSFYNDSWDVILRLPHNGTTPIPPNPDDPDDPDDPNKKTLYDEIKETKYNTDLLTAEEVKELKSLHLGDTCFLKHTFRKNKKPIGRNFLGKRLMFNTLEYNIHSVDGNGYVKIYYKLLSLYYIVNPKYIRKEKP